MLPEGTLQRNQGGKALHGGASRSPCRHMQESRAAGLSRPGCCHSSHCHDTCAFWSDYGTKLICSLFSDSVQVQNMKPEVFRSLLNCSLRAASSWLRSWLGDEAQVGNWLQTHVHSPTPRCLGMPWLQRWFRPQSVEAPAHWSGHMLLLHHWCPGCACSIDMSTGPTFTC